MEIKFTDGEWARTITQDADGKYATTDGLEVIEEAELKKMRQRLEDYDRLTRAAMNKISSGPLDEVSRDDLHDFIVALVQDLKHTMLEG